MYTLDQHAGSMRRLTHSFARLRDILSDADDPARSDACHGNNWYPDCKQVYEDCVSLYTHTVLQVTANCSAVPLWPVSPSVGWMSGVDTATGVPNGQLVENDRVGEHCSGYDCQSRPNQGALDVHGPYQSANSANSLMDGQPEARVLFHSEFGVLSLPQFETMAAVMPLPAMWSVYSAAQMQRSPNGAGKRTVDFITAMLGDGLADYSATAEGYRRASYLSQLAQSESMRSVVDAGRLGLAAINNSSGVWDRPWGYMFWQLNDVTQGYSWGSLEYGGRMKLMHYRSAQWFAPVRVECNTVDHRTISGGGGSGGGSSSKVTNCSFSKGVDYAWSDMTEVTASSQEDCCAKCGARAHCAAGVFVAKDHACWVKTAADLKHKVKARSGIATVACVTHGNEPPPPPSIICTAANDGPVAWSGKVSLAIASMTALSGAQPNWSKVFSIGPVPPGEARRFGLDDTAAVTACPPTGGPCWLYGGLQQKLDISSTTARLLRADIGVPLKPLKSLISSAQLPRADVSVSVTSTNATEATLAVTAFGAAALYVHLTTAAQGQFSESGFHMRAGERRELSFSAWVEHGSLDGVAFTKSLYVHWLNSK